jgi:hypothetical protein
MKLLLIAGRCRPTQVFTDSVTFAKVFGDEGTGETGRTDDDDVEFTWAAVHDLILFAINATCFRPFSKVCVPTVRNPQPS